MLQWPTSIGRCESTWRCAAAARPAGAAVGAPATAIGAVAAKLRHRWQRRRWASSIRSSTAECPRRRRGRRSPRASARTSWWPGRWGNAGGSRHAGRVALDDPLRRLRAPRQPKATTSRSPNSYGEPSPRCGSCAQSSVQHGETEDLVQETYLRALRSLPRFRGEAPVRRVAAVDRQAHLRRPRPPPPAPAPPARPPDDRGRQRRRRRRRRRCLDGDLLQQLDPDRREAFALTQLAGLSYEEAAAVVECPIGTIRSRVARARADLRALLDVDVVAS